MFISRTLISFLAIGTSTLLFSNQVQASPVLKLSGSPADQIAAREINVASGSSGLLGVFERSGSLEMEKRIVYNPRITEPTETTIWTAGSTGVITWDTSDMPDEVKGNDSQVKLGYTLPNGEGGLNQHWTLASGFKIDAGTVTVKIPADLETRSTYQVVLFGDSGNTSPEFTINGVAPDPLEAVTSEGFPFGSQGLRSVFPDVFEQKRGATSKTGLIGREVDVKA